jgi:bifunctional UDP-N-acetylglucosamine pyrophosphorylase / glucosamine-1-phosphate N-acetyltransferase
VRLRDRSFKESNHPMSENARRCLTIVLAAGEGVRMRSTRPKVLHELAGRSMLAHALSAVLAGAMGDIAVVVASEPPRLSKPRRKRKSPSSLVAGEPPTRFCRRAI